MRKLFSKPIVASSPRRAEKFQPPPHLLSRFLPRSNAGCRSSRGRSLASPMFSPAVSRKKKADIETQEPSSPKVTCFGQVRARRSSANKTAACGGRGWLERVLFCSRSSRNPRKRRICCPLSRYRAEASPIGDSRPKTQGEVAGEKKFDFAAAASSVPGAEVSAGHLSPPRNALLLMRCRSAPHRSDDGLRSVAPSVRFPPTGAKVAATAEERGQVGVSSRPLFLTRCRSEPASMTGERSIWWRAGTGSPLFPSSDRLKLSLSQCSRVFEKGFEKGLKNY